MDTVKSGKSVEESLRDELSGIGSDETEVQSTTATVGSGEGSSDAGEKTNQDTPKDEAETSSPTDKVYKTLDGREVSADQLFEEYDYLARDYTRKSQELAKLEKAGGTDKTSEKIEDSQLSAQDQAVLKELKRLKVLTSEDVLKILEERDAKVVSKAADVTSSRMEYQNAKAELKKDFPFVDLDKVDKFVAGNPNTELSLLDIARTLHYKDFVAAEIEGRKATNLPETEGSGVGNSEPAKPNYSFKDGSAERAVRDLLKNA